MQVQQRVLFERTAALDALRLAHFRTSKRRQRFGLYRQDVNRRDFMHNSIGPLPCRCGHKMRACAINLESTAHHAGDAPLLDHLPDEILKLVEPLAVHATDHTILDLAVMVQDVQDCRNIYYVLKHVQPCDVEAATARQSQATSSEQPSSEAFFRSSK